jgi:hypothetical protein
LPLADLLSVPPAKPNAEPPPPMAWANVAER